MSEKRRILFVAPTGFFSDYGCHVRIRGQAEALQRRGYEVAVVSYPVGRDVPGLKVIRPQAKLCCSEVPVGASWRRLILDAMMTPSLFRFLRSFRPSLVHVFLHEGILVGTLPAALHRVPLVLDFQGSVTDELVGQRFVSADSVVVPLLARLERWLDRVPRLILANSNHGAGVLERAFGVPRDRIRVVPDSVDPRHFRPPTAGDEREQKTLRDRLRLPADRPIVAYLGLFAPHQGVDLLLEAAAWVIRRAEQTGKAPPHFLVMGFPGVDEYRRQAARLGITPHVTFTGAIPYEEAPAYLRMGTCAVAPKVTVTEGCGKVLTYMATGLPVIASDIPVHREYLGDLGIYVRGREPEAWGRAILDVLEAESELRSLGEALRQRVVSNYDWEQAGRRIERAYREIWA